MKKKTCENCGRVFEYEPHAKFWEGNADDLVVRNTGKNVVYFGQKDEEYTLCPGCDFCDVENPLTEEV